MSTESNIERIYKEAAMLSYAYFTTHNPLEKARINAELVLLQKRLSELERFESTY